ncbi:MAG: hypothetical protein BGO98_16210 [Myxococcales bacterium 68-20]|nr:hypothetical protein [Myxococcales bacterium]OJY31570.1 MAG: hypothetical protein BGO98_16210 [Myxococcales bacterium 68-20]
MTARHLYIVLAAFLALAPSVACSAAQKAAREDPMRCERDPKCEQKRGRTADCSMQCSDDPACVERCEQIQAPTKLGR